MKEYKITEQVLQATMQFLATRPYADVFQLIQQLQASQEIKEEDKKEIKTKKNG